MVYVVVFNIIIKLSYPILSSLLRMERCVLVQGVRAGLVKDRCRWYVLQCECDVGADASKSACQAD